MLSLYENLISVSVSLLIFEQCKTSANTRSISVKMCNLSLSTLRSLVEFARGFALCSYLLIILAFSDKVAISGGSSPSKSEQNSCSGSSLAIFRTCI